jgi:hypothetical protein
VSEAWTDSVSIFKAISNRLREAVYAYGSAVDSDINDALSEGVTAEADEANQLTIQGGLPCLGMYRHPDGTRTGGPEVMEHQSGLEAHDAVWNSFHCQQTHGSDDRDSW